MAALADDLHVVPVDLLHRLDLLRCRWICGALRARVRDDLSGPVFGYAWMVVDIAKAGTHRTHPAHYIYR